MNDKKTVFIDLDGPILDVSDRYYRLYVDILRQRGFSALSKEEYWNAKRNKVHESKILEHTDALAVLESYLQQRKILIESDQYLRFDRIQDGTFEALENLLKRRELVLITLRTIPEQLCKELKYFGLDQYFSAVLTSKADIKPRWKIKYNLISTYLKEKAFSESLIIGDTETDIIAGNNLRIKTIAVLNGIRSYELLRDAQPTFIINSINEISRNNEQYLA